MSEIRTPPSGASRWVPCPGSPFMQSQFPRTESHPVAEQGKAIHWACEGVLFSWLPKNNIPPKDIRGYLGLPCPENGVILDEDMIAAGLTYLEAVWAEVHTNLAKILPEMQLRTGAIRPGMKGGRCDLLWWNSAGTHLTVIDGKFGYAPVDAVRNEQLAIYAMSGLFDTIETIDMIIIQPRGPSRYHPVKRWRQTAPQLMEFCELIGQSYDEAQKGPDARTVAGPWCLHCQAAGNCTTLEVADYRIVERPRVANLETLDPKTLSFELGWLKRAQKMIRARHDALEANALHRIEGGETIPGWEVDHPLSNRKWEAPDEQIIALGTLMNGKDLTERVIIGPRQAEIRGIPTFAVNALTTRSPGQPTLKRIANA